MKKYGTILLLLMFMLLLFYPLFIYESLQNETYIVARSISAEMDPDKINNLSKIDNVLFVSALRYIYLNKTMLIEATENFGIFASKYILKGRLPDAQNEVIGIYSQKNEVFVGDEISFNNTMYKIVGIIQLSDLINIVGDLSNFVTIIKFSKAIPPSIHIAVACIYALSDMKSVIEKFREELGKGITVYPLTFFEMKRFNAIQIIITSIIGYIGMAFLYVMSVRKDCAVLFALGWRIRNVFARIYVEYFIISFLSCIMSLLLLMIVLNQLRLYFFINYVIALPALNIFLGALFVSVFSYIFVIKKATEVLFE